MNKTLSSSRECYNYINGKINDKIRDDVNVNISDNINENISDNINDNNNDIPMAYEIYELEASLPFNKIQL